MAQDRPDMFDVASGECELVEFLLTRFNPVDLKVKIRIDPSVKLDEQVAPPPEEPTAPEAPAPEPPQPEPQRISVQHQPKPDAVPEALPPEPKPEPPPYQPEPASPASVTPVEPPAAAAEEPAPPTSAVDLLSLIQGFHAAAQRYNTETSWDAPPQTEEPEA